jgi:rhomboid protease GluP
MNDKQRLFLCAESVSTTANSKDPEAPSILSNTQECAESPKRAPQRRDWLSTTRILIACNVLVFLAMLIHSLSITGMQAFLNTRIAANFDSELLRRWGSLYGPLALGGQFWRVITSQFVHLNAVHLMFNMLFLWRLGKPLDRLFDRTQTLGIYLLTGAAASVCSLGWQPLADSVGASGGVYGQAGVLIAQFGIAQGFP